MQSPVSSAARSSSLRPACSPCSTDRSSNSLEIALVIRRFGARWGGAERWTGSFAHWLLDQGHRVHLISQDAPAADCDPRLLVHRIAHSGRWEFAEQAAEIIERLDVQLVHDMGHGWRADLFQPHSGSPWSTVYRQQRWRFGLLDRLARTLCTWGPRFRQLDSITQRQVACPASQFLFVSSLVSQEYRHWHQLPTQRHHVVHNAVDAQRFHDLGAVQRAAVRQTLGVDDDELLILFIANNFRLKGFAHLLEAASLLSARHPRFRIHAIGSGGTRRWQRLGDRYGLRGRLSFQSYAADTVQYYNACDVFVLPTHYDSCSLTVLEAMAVGRPVITTADNGAAELIENNQTGIVIDHASNVQQLAASMVALTDPHRRQRMGEAARQRMSQRSMHDNFQEVLNLYHQILVRRNSTPTASAAAA